MIKVNWNIDSKEKQRILNLHENATKNLYLIKEQEIQTKTTEKSWSLCEYTVYQNGDKFFIELNEGQTVEIPKLSEVSGVIKNKKLVLNQLTQNGIIVGELMKETNTCANKFPQSYKGNIKWFCYLDDVSKILTGDRNKGEKMVNIPTPRYGVLCQDGTLGTGGGDFLDVETQKDNNGVIIQYGVSRSKSFIFEVSSAMAGSLEKKSNPPTPTPTPIPKTIELNVESPFVFDKTDLTPEATEKFNEFVSGIKRDYQGVTGNVDVITSASIDAEPKSKEKYNMDLSVRRANAIIDKLKSMLGQTSLTFIPKPIGQTDQFAPGLKWPEVKDSTKTAPNRRLIIRLPKITKKFE